MNDRPAEPISGNFSANAAPCGKKLACPHCPFQFKNNTEGADFDDEFTTEHVDAWVNSEPWLCHKHPEGGVPCSGQALFKAGKLDITRKELEDFWVHQTWEGEPPAAG